MNREILFRGKRATNGEWLYGDLLQSKCDDTTYAYIRSETVLRVDPSTVGQFTGLRDRNETPIFEGDIIAGYDEDTGRAEEVGFLVVYRDAAFCVKYQGDAPLYHVLERGDCEYLAVVGNVHDSPELLNA